MKDLGLLPQHVSLVRTAQITGRSTKILAYFSGRDALSCTRICECILHTSIVHRGGVMYLSRSKTVLKLFAAIGEARHFIPQRISLSRDFLRLCRG